MIARPVRSLGESASTASAAMLASARSASGRSSSRRSACLTSIETPLSAALRSVASTACGSKSNASYGLEAELCRRNREDTRAAADVEHAPALLAGEQPKHSCVVGCPPVPNARPGSMTTAIAPSSGSSHGGPIQSEPTRTGLWNCRQRSSQSSSTSDGCGASERLPDPLLAGGIGVGGELQPALPFDLLEALREELDHHRTRLLGPSVGDGHRDAAQERHARPGHSANGVSELLEEALVAPVGVFVREASRSGRGARAARRSGVAGRRR